MHTDIRINLCIKCFFCLGLCENEFNELSILFQLWYSFQSDLWSLGISSIEMAEGKPRKYLPHKLKPIFFVVNVLTLHILEEKFLHTEENIICTKYIVLYLWR